MCGWPHSLWDWDILFLIPLPWWGPVLAPVLISLLMILWGTLATQFERSEVSWMSLITVWGFAGIGMALALWVFMADTLRVAGNGVNAVRTVLPERFNWPVFSFALFLMALPSIEAALGLLIEKSRARDRESLNGIGQPTRP